MLADYLRFGGFVTLFHAVLDQSSGHLTYVTGGHESPVIYRADLMTAEMLLPNGQLLGAVADVEESSNTLTMGAGDVNLAVIAMVGGFGLHCSCGTFGR